jgi:hypothetical protein
MLSKSIQQQQKSINQNIEKQMQKTIQLGCLQLALFDRVASFAVVQEALVLH